MNAAELLKQFCAKDDEWNPWQEYIILQDALLYATNGHVMAIMQDDGSADTYDEVNQVAPSNLHSFYHDDFTDFIPLVVDLPEIIPCGTCKGTGKAIAQVNCPDCSKGYFFHGGNEYECKTCDGSGEGDEPYGTKTEACESCDGTGNYLYQPVSMPDGRLFARRYIAMLMALPGICYLPDAEDDKAAMKFKFNGGVGRLMPRRK